MILKDLERIILTESTEIVLLTSFYDKDDVANGAASQKFLCRPWRNMSTNFYDSYCGRKTYDRGDLISDIIDNPMVIMKFLAILFILELQNQFRNR